MSGRRAELARAFTRLGLTAFGGPAAHLAIMQREFVDRRAWLSPQRYVDLIGLASLLPGPTSTEVALGIGFERARWSGLLIAALGFVVPASLIVLAIAILYTDTGLVDGARHLLYGMSPVVIAVIAHAMIRLSTTALTDRPTWLAGMGAFVISLIVLQPIAILIAGALLVLAARRLPDVILRARGAPAMLVLQPGGLDPLAGLAGVAVTLGLGALFLTFLRIGLVVFGSGYVLVAFLGSEFVAPGYLTEQQLIDAVAIGQLTPGPVFTAATFIGYLLAGIPGAVVATVAIFLPSIVLVGLAHPFLPRMRANETLSTAVDGLNAAALGLIGASVVLLARDALAPGGAIDAVALALGAAAFGGLLSGRSGPVPLLLAGALVGLLVRLLAD